MALRRFVEKFKAVQRVIIRVVQRVILQVSLFFLYYIGFGLSRLFMTVFARRVLFNRPRRRPPGDTYWRDAEGYELEEAGLRRQS